MRGRSRRNAVMRGDYIESKENKFKAVNIRNRNFTNSKFACRLAHLEADVSGYVGLLH